MFITWRGLSLLLDGGTAVCAAFNSSYFLGRLFWGREQFRPRLTAIAVLGAVCLGVTLEAAALVAIAAESEERDAMSSFGWWAVRCLTFLGTAGMAALIARRVLGR